jgi:cell wall-associated NlpC family hydrolase
MTAPLKLALVAALALVLAAALPLRGGLVMPRAAEAQSVAVILSQWSDLIHQAADEAGVPWQVVASILIIESGGDPAASSPSGAAGLMQLRPEQWQARAGQFGGDVWDPWTNIRTGAAILADAYATWGTWDQAVASYVGALDEAGAITAARDDDGRTGEQYVAVFRRQVASLGYPVAPTGTMTMAEGALRIAMSTIGTPYVWGGESYEEGGFDCSGLVLWAYTHMGATLPRTAAEQWAATTRLAPADVRPGDLIFFFNTVTVANAEQSRIGSTGQQVITHVGIYAGNGQMLHAPREYDRVRLTPLDTPYWRAHLIGYGRVE